MTRCQIRGLLRPVKAGRPPFRWCSALALAWCCLATNAHAQPDFIEARPGGALPAYRLEVASRLTRVQRQEFAEPLFMFQQPVDDLIARQFSSQLFFQFRLFPALYSEFTVPFAWRLVEARFRPVLISAGETLPARWVDLESKGIGDPTAALIARVYDSPAWKVQSRLGVVIPHDDNPGSNTVPTRVPLGNGQAELFVQPALGLDLGSYAVGMEYRFGFHPGNVATYLVRKVDEQSYAAGALAPHLSHRWRLWLDLFENGRFGLRLAPELTVDENPLIVERGRAYRFHSELVRWDLGLEASLRVRLTETQRLALSYKHWFLESWQTDPFFPIDIPDQGLGVAWNTRGF